MFHPPAQLILAGFFVFKDMDLRPIHGSGKSYARKAKRAVERSTEMLLIASFNHKFGKLKEGATTKEKKERSRQLRAFVAAGFSVRDESKAKEVERVRGLVNERLRKSAEKGRAPIQSEK